MTMTEAEWSRRVELAACYRLVDLYGMSDGIGTHISASIPRTDAEFLINPYGSLFDEVTASSLVKVDAEGRALGSTDSPVNPAGFVLHSCIHLSPRQVVCVLHTHTEAGMAVSALKEGLLPLSQHAIQFYGRIAYHDYEGLVTNHDEQQRFVRDLGENKALVLRNHGLLTVGESVAEAFYQMWRLEKACRTQLRVMAVGRELVLPDDQTARKTSDTYWGSSPLISELAWSGFRRRLDRLNPGYES